MKTYTQDFVNELNHSIDMLRKEANQRYREAADLAREVEVLTQERDRLGVDVETLRLQVSVLTSQAQEAETLMVERDNALLEIERLNGELNQAVSEAKKYGGLSSSGAADALRGGVHPNA